MRKKIIHGSFAAIIALCCSLILCSCGSESTYISTASDYSGISVASSKGLSATDSAVEYSNEYTETSSASGETDTDLNDKIIYSGNVTMETMDFDTCVQNIKSMIAEENGYIESCSVETGTYYETSQYGESAKYAYITARIPAGKYSLVMDKMPSFGNVTYSNTYAENISDQYYDIEAHKEAYIEQRSALKRLLETADSTEAVLQIYQELEDVQYRIDSLETQLKRWDKQVQYSSVSIQINEVFEYTPEESKYSVALTSRIHDAFSEGMETASDVLVGIVRVLPSILTVCIAIGVVVMAVVLIKRTCKGIGESTKSKKKKSGKRPANSTEEPISGQEQKQ